MPEADPRLRMNIGGCGVADRRDVRRTAPRFFFTSAPQRAGWGGFAAELAINGEWKREIEIGKRQWTHGEKGDGGGERERLTKSTRRTHPELALEKRRASVLDRRSRR
jgi:hypothetical protein